MVSITTESPTARKHPNRFSTSVLYAAFGTTFCLRPNQPETYMSELSPEERAWVHHMYGDSRSSAAEYGYDPSTWWTYRLPASVCQQLAGAHPPERVKDLWFEGDQPRVNPHGGDGCPSGPALASAWHMTEFHRFLDRRISTMLEPHSTGGEQPGVRPILFIGALFPGSSHGPGVTIPALIALDHILKTRHLLNASQRVLMITLPDFADGISESRLQQQRANTFGFLLALDAIHSRLRRQGAFSFRLGDWVFEIANHLVDEIMVYGGQGKAGFLSPEEISRVVAHCQGIFGAQGTGVGRGLEDHAVRLRQVKLAGAGNHSMFLGRLGVYEIRLDKELAALRLGQRCAMVAVEMLMAPRSDDAKKGVPVLAQRISEGKPPQRWLREVLSKAWPLTVPKLPDPGGDVSPGQLERICNLAYNMAEEEAKRSATRFTKNLVDALDAETDRGLLERLLDGHLDALGAEMDEANYGLRQLGHEVRNGAKQLRHGAGVTARNARNVLMDRMTDENRKDLLAGFFKQLSQAMGMILQAGALEAAAETLEKMAAKFQGRVSYTVGQCLQRLGDSVKPPRGFFYRKVKKDVDWERIRKPMPTMEVLWTPEIEDILFAETQPLQEQGSDGAWHARPAELGKVLRARHSNVADALRRGDERAVIRELEEHFTQMFAAKLEEYSFSSFCKTFLSQTLREALAPSLRSAFSFAYGWASKYDHVDEVEHQTIVEVPEDDPEADALFKLAAALVPENVALRKQYGNRGKSPALIVAQAAHGYTLPNLAGFDHGGDYSLAFKKQYKLFRAGLAGPVLGDKRFEKLIADEFAEWRPLLK